MQGASWAPEGGPFVTSVARRTGRRRNAGCRADPAALRGATLDSLRALMLIRSYRVRGHLNANLDPLGIEGRDPHPELDPATYGFTEADMDRPIFIDHVLGLETATMREIEKVLRLTYSGNIGYEFMHIQYPEQKAWIQERIEGHNYRPHFTEEGRRKILEQLTHAEGFERFLHLKYTGTKRFGCDGAESLIPLLEAINKRAALSGVKEILIGMPHRGRLNVLANVMAKPYLNIFAEFQGSSAHPDDVQGSGDVKYHLGTSADREFEGESVHLSLSANPSHLEAVNPVVLGKARAKQLQHDDTDRDKVLSVIMHGDAAFAGQGIVAECFALSDLRGYRTGGTIHVVVNNQIGFTTSPGYSRSSPYPSDLAKGIQAPVFHVNGDDPEAVVHVARLATDFRQTFHRDVVIDMFCYRRHGHNEGDEPAFTQPLMYRQIKDHKPTREIYADFLENKIALLEIWRGRRNPCGLPRQTGRRLQRRIQLQTQQGRLARRRLEGIEDRQRRCPAWQDRRCAKKLCAQIGESLTTVPEDFNLHRTIRRQLATKKEIIKSGDGVDWATAEALAFGSLLAEGHGVRLSGQDSQRGTFSQRHAVLIDQDTEDRYIPLETISPDQAKFEVVDSLLSEFAVLGFEYGYSQTAPSSLVMWEAQFGDFRQWRASDRRSVYFVGREQVAAHERSRDVAAARLRGAGPRAQFGTARALFATLRRRQHAGSQLHHASELFPHPAPAGAPRFPQAPHLDDAKVVAAPQARDLQPFGTGRQDQLPSRAVG